MENSKEIVSGRHQSDFLIHMLQHRVMEAINCDLEKNSFKCDFHLTVVGIIELGNRYLMRQTGFCFSNGKPVVELKLSKNSYRDQSFRKYMNKKFHSEVH